jgi:hypothetical protein
MIDVGRLASNGFAAKPIDSNDSGRATNLRGRDGDLAKQGAKLSRRQSVSRCARRIERPFYFSTQRCIREPACSANVAWAPHLTDAPWFSRRDGILHRWEDGPFQTNRRPPFFQSEDLLAGNAR